MKRFVMIGVLVVFGVVAVFVAGFRGVPRVFAQQSASYVGVDKCKGCHPKQYEGYKAKKFAKAWAVMEMRGKTRDEKCLKCHSTGFGKTGGFISEESTPNMKHKQCEVCHGPGSAHAANPGDSEASKQLRSFVSEKNVCIECHICVRTHREADF